MKRFKKIIKKTIKKNKKNRTTRKKRIFTKKQYTSGDGMLTTVWGPSMWHYLHTMSFNYPNNPTKEEREQYKSFILQLQYVLPCKYCRVNLTNNFKHMPIKECHMKNRFTFSKYMYDLHEIVNKMLKKKSNLSYCDVRERYEHFRARCSKKEKLFKFNKTRKEKGCTESLYGKKAKCVIKIVPQENKCKTFQMDNKCVKKSF
jgi:hypothetical protein